MAVIHMLTPEYWPEVGGVADYTRLVARGLAEAGDQVHVWCPSGGRGDPADRVDVHPDFGRFGAADLARVGAQLDQFRGPRRLLVQWVPHAYGFRAMNLNFCVWLWGRARRGDEVEIVVHEPFLAFWGGSWRQTAAAVVHRVMTVVLLQAARRVWVAIPAWESMWKPYTLGRPIPFRWLPIPSSLSLGAAEAKAAGAVRAEFGASSRPLVGHLGTYGSLVAPLVDSVFAEILRQPRPPRAMLIGQGSEEFRGAFVARHPEQAASIYATGELDEVALAAHVAACDVLVQPYPDGISSRRTSAMAGLALGVPIVTTHGRLTEALWKDSGAVRLIDVGEFMEMAAEVMDLLEHPDARAALGEAGRALYNRAFDQKLIIDALRGVSSGRAA